MDSIDDDSANRVEVELDLFDDEIYTVSDVKSLIGNRFKDFSPKQKQGFAEKIIEKQQQTGVPDKKLIDQATTLSGMGFDMKRHVMVRDSETGRYIGGIKNIVITSKQGTRVFVRNTKTGKTGRIK